MANAGTRNASGKLGGMNCVTGWKTGPSFGSAGNRGRIQIMAMKKAVYIPAMMVAPHLWPDARPMEIRISGVTKPRI